MLVAGFLYFQLSTYTLLQWVRQHVPREEPTYTVTNAQMTNPSFKSLNPRALGSAAVLRNEVSPAAVAEPQADSDTEQPEGSMRLSAGKDMDEDEPQEPAEQPDGREEADVEEEQPQQQMQQLQRQMKRRRQKTQTQAQQSVELELQQNEALHGVAQLSDSRQTKRKRATRLAPGEGLSNSNGEVGKIPPSPERSSSAAAAGADVGAHTPVEQPSVAHAEEDVDGPEPREAADDKESADERPELDEGLHNLDDVRLADGDAGGKKVATWIESDAYGKFIGISTFFNPGRHQNKVDNFRQFRASVAQQGLQMLCVELVFGQAPNQLRDDDCDILIHRRTAEGNTLWQKERLLNIALENLPNTVEKVMWLDSDLIFLNDNWVPETAELLDQFPVVQPFGWMTYLPADTGVEFAEEKLATLPLGQGVGYVYHSAGLGISSFGDVVFRANFILGHPGFAWAARREVICAAGFYDRSIIGGGDRIMVNAFTGHFGGISRKMPAAMASSVREFGRKLEPLVGPANVSYTQGVVLHIWHGDRANRDYTHRYEILVNNRYDPATDVRVNADGVLEWASSKEFLHKQVTDYFNNRKEGPRPNQTRVESDDAEELAAQKRGASRAVRSYIGYHCRAAAYRPPCKIAFKLWGEALRFTQLQLHQKQLRKLQAEQAAQFRAQRLHARHLRKSGAKKSKRGMLLR